MAKWFVAYANVGGTWEPAGAAWDSQGGENVAPIAAMRDGNPVWLYTWDSDTGQWQSGPFDAQASAATRPRAIVSLYSSGGNYRDTASMDSLLWSAYNPNLVALAAQQGMTMEYSPSSEGLSIGRNVFTLPDANAWIADVGNYH